MSRSHIKPKSLFWQIKHRREQFDFATDLLNKVADGEEDSFIVFAPVKSGKKDIVINCSLITNDKKPNIVKSYFVTAYHRKANEEQYAELESYNIDVHPIKDKKCFKKAIKQMKEDIDNYEEIQIQIDELDYGSNKKMLLARIHDEIKSSPKIKRFYYSATPQEMMPQNLVSIPPWDKPKLLKFKPHKSYYGIKRYLEDGRFHEAEPFFEYINNETEETLDFTAQGWACMRKLADQTKDKSNIINSAVLRLSGNVPGSTKKKKTTWYEKVKDFTQDAIEISIQKLFHKEFGIKLMIKFIGHKDNPWPTKYEEWYSNSGDIAFLYIVCEKAKRSTEWRNHPCIAWYHTYRDDPNYSTAGQSQARPAHYEGAYENDPYKPVKFKDIKCEIYGNTKLAEVQAGIRSHLELTKISANCKVKKNATLSTHEVDMKEFNNWNDIDDRFKKKRKEKDFLKNCPKLSQKMRMCLMEKQSNGKFKKKEVEITIPDEKWEMIKNLEGFRLCNCRGSINKFLKTISGYDGKSAKYMKPPIYNRDHWKNELKEGLNKRSKTRLNICYTNLNEPDNFFYICRYVTKTTPLCKQARTVKNVSMYNNV